MPPRVKSGANYHNARLAVMEARTNGYAGQPIMLNERGKVSEGPGACFFLVRDGAMITAPVTSNILESITRETVLELGRDVLRLRVVEREIDRTEIYIADEAFFCGSGWEVTPVRSVDRYQIGKVWRYDKPQAGRYREFYQADADILGSYSTDCEVELLLMASFVFPPGNEHTMLRKNNEIRQPAIVPASTHVTPAVMRSGCEPHTVPPL